MKKPLRPKPSRKMSHPVPADEVQTFYFECSADPKEIRKVEPFMNQINDAAHLDDGTFYRLLVAGTEAVNNSILHGSKSDPTKKVSVTCTIDKDSLIFRVRDEGKGFKPEEVPDPLEEKNLLKTSGRGIFLMRSLMDKVSFKITRKGTEVELVIDLKHLGQRS
jgi:serine/threonine-protein kinase RsbW